MRLRDLVIGILIFSGITVGMMIFYEETAHIYEEDYPDIVGTYSTNRTFATLGQTQEIVNLTQEMSEKLANITSKTNILTAVYDSFVLGFDFFGLLLKIPSMAIGVFKDTTEIFTTIGIPPWFMGMIEGIILVVVVFTIISIFLKRGV